MSVRVRALRLIGPVALALAGSAGAFAAGVAARRAALEGPSGRASEAPAELPFETGADAARARGFEIVLPEGFFLDLANGLVTSRKPAQAAGDWIGLADGRFVGPVALRRLAVTAVGEAAGAVRSDGRGALRRGDGEPVSELVPRAGDELVFELDAAHPERGWGWLRIVHAGPSGVTVELVAAPADAQLLERAPRRIEVTSVEGGLELAWSHLARVEDAAGDLAGDANGDAGWLVWRAAVPAARGLGAKRFRLVARVAASPYVDRELEPEVLYEYRVARAGVACLAARARGVQDGVTGEGLVTVDRGSVVSLLTGSSDGRRVDLRVDFANEDGVQLSPGDGASLRLLNGSEETDWMLPDPGDGSYTTPRTFLQSGRSLAVALSEGLLARVFIEAGQGGSPGLRWSVDYGGGRLFPQPPDAPLASFSGEGAVFDFAASGAPSSAAARAAELKGVVAAPRAGLAGLPPGTSIVMLREDEYGSQRFVEVLEGEPGSTRLVDPVGVHPRIVRYRFLHRSAVSDSPPGEPLRLLLVDRSDEAAVEALVSAAIEELGRPDFEQRSRARAVLEELGTRAIDELSEALGSDDPEVAGAAKDILISLETAPDEGAPAPAALVLRARAAGLGLAQEPPLAELVDARACVRALALFGARPDEEGARVELERWRAMMTESDPDEGVRLVGALTASMVREPWRPELERLAAPSAGGAADRAPDLAAAARLARALPAARTLADARDLLADALTEPVSLDAWHELALCTLYWDLEQAARGEREGGDTRALARLALALGLLDEHAESGEPVFLDALEQMYGDPWVYMMARRTFALRRARRLDDVYQPRDVVRLAAADGAELSELLSELAEQGARDVALLLPPGVYDWEVGDRSDLAVPGLWLVGEGEAGDVHLRGMLSIQGAADVVLANLTIDGENRPALSITDASVALKDCRLAGTGSCIAGARAVVQLERCELGANRPRTSVTGVRFTGDGLFVARDCLFVAEGGAVQSARDAYLERCVIEAGRRNGIDGTQQGGLVLVDCLIESEASGVSNVGRGVLEGVVFVGRAASGLSADVAWCAEHVRASGPSGDLMTSDALERCPLGRAPR